MIMAVAGEALQHPESLETQSETISNPDYYFGKLDDYHGVLMGISSEIEELNSRDDQGRLEVASEILKSLSLLQEATKMFGLLPPSIKPYFDHDAKTPVSTFFAWIKLCESSLKPKRGPIVLEDVKEACGKMREFWSVFRYIFEDIILRMGQGGESSIDKKYLNKDRGVDLNTLLQSIQVMVQGCAGSKGRLALEIEPDFETVASAKVVIPHGAIFNSLNNYAKNALHQDIKASRAKVRIVLEGSRVIFEVKDDGRGMPEEMFKDPRDPRNIFRKGVTVNKYNGTGLGLAYAPERFRSADCDLQVESKINPTPGSGEFVTIFRLIVPVITH